MVNYYKLFLLMKLIELGLFFSPLYQGKVTFFKLINCSEKTAHLPQ